MGNPERNEVEGNQVERRTGKKSAQRVRQAKSSVAKLQHKRRQQRNVRRAMFKYSSVLFLLTVCGSSLGWASTRVEATKPLILQSSETALSQLPAISDKVAVDQEQEMVSPGASPAIRKNIQVSLGEALLTQLPTVTQETPIPRRAEFLSQASPQLIRQGNQISLNGRTFRVPWRQWQLGTAVRTGISDVGLMQTLGVDLLSTDQLTRQPVQWFSEPQRTPLVLPSLLSGAYRYLDVTDFVKTAGLQLVADGDSLKIASVPAQVKDIRVGTQEGGSRIVIDLNRPTPWQLSNQRTEGVITLEGLADPTLVERFTAPPPEQIQDSEDAAPVSVDKPSDTPVIRVENGQNQATIRVTIPAGKRLQVFSLPNPNRLVIDLRPETTIDKDILWAPGIWWRQRYVNLENSRFPVVWLEINPRTPGLSFRPIWGNPATQTGTTPLMQMAPLWQAAAAINAGFFNRNNQLPLGAIRRDGRWFSGPILNRGAIAWNDLGQFKLGHLTLQKTLLTSTGQRLPIILLNSGYVQAGLARYTSEWGQTYTPLTDNEVIFFVQNNQITNQISAGTAGQQSLPIPTDGYLLTLRTTNPADVSLDVGTQVSIEESTVPGDFQNYPHILGAGPLLLQNRQIVLDAKAERFSDAFNQQSAVRSSVATTASGSLIFAAIHNRIGGLGPNLQETAQLMQLLGAVDALNLDGGSSTGLYLGGQLLDRSPYTAARVHNSFGIFRTAEP